jgi:hypothetical protein
MSLKSLRKLPTPEIDTERMPGQWLRRTGIRARLLRHPFRRARPGRVPGHARLPALPSRTEPHSQRCTGSASSRGCQSLDVMNLGVGTDSGKVCIPARSLPACRSGMVAIRFWSTSRPSTCAVLYVKKRPRASTAERTSEAARSGSVTSISSRTTRSRTSLSPSESGSREPT